MMTGDANVESREDIERVLGCISFAPSCVDMGWRWIVESAIVSTEEGAIPGWMIRCSFQRPERDSGEIGAGYGRRWWIEAGATESGVVKTAWLAARQIVEHEMMEAFKVGGMRPWDPHRTIAELTWKGGYVMGDWIKVAQAAAKASSDAPTRRVRVRLDFVLEFDRDMSELSIDAVHVVDMFACLRERAERIGAKLPTNGRYRLNLDHRKVKP